MGKVINGQKQNEQMMNQADKNFKQLIEQESYN